MGRIVGKPRVLFLCSHNAARSQLAEALLRHHGGERFLAFSAGLKPTQLNPLVKQVLEEINVDNEGLQSKDLKEFWSGKHHFAYTITVCAAAEEDCPEIFPFVSKRLFWPTEGTNLTRGSRQEQLTKMRHVRDQLSQQIQSWLPTAEDQPVFARPF